MIRSLLFAHLKAIETIKIHFVCVYRFCRGSSSAADSKHVRYSEQSSNFNEMQTLYPNHHSQAKPALPSIGNLAEAALVSLEYPSQHQARKPRCIVDNETTMSPRPAMHIKPTFSRAVVIRHHPFIIKSRAHRQSTARQEVE